MVVRSVDVVEEELRDARGHLAEVDVQASSEAAHYGDAWGGAADDIEATMAAIEELEAELAALR